MAKKKREEAHENLERWLLTYADMITLLMLFFIVLYSMSNVDTEKYKKISQALQTIFQGGNMGIFEEGIVPGQGGILTGGRGILDSAGQLPSEKGKSQKKKIHISKIKGLLKQDVTTGRVSVVSNEIGIVVTLASDAYFESGSAELLPDAKATLKKIADLLLSFDNNVRIEGHTDDNPFKDLKTDYHTNWELSAARSLKVLGYIEASGVKKNRLSAIAYGSSRPKVPNETPEDRATNRRVEIVIVDN
ncbi:MAG: flagellar motor protein MotB [Spirochaetes bacterium]|nr:MAG: flagellar motor protein MotB [Spirochaetota bacterium]